MKNFQLISEINGAPWFIHKPWVDANAAIISGILTGKADNNFGTPKAYDDDRPEPAYQPRIVGGVQMVDGYTLSYKSDRIQPGAIFELNIEGPIFRQAVCAYGTIDYTEWFDIATNHPNVVGAAIKIHSPGGSAWGTQMLVQAIERFQAAGKPVVAFINDGMAASAGYWIAAACNEIYIGSTTDALGSIGVYSTIYDFSGYLKKEGVVEHIIYAPQSTEKNQEHKEALKGNYAPFQAQLSQFADTFINSVKANRNVNEAVLKGAMFMGQNAIDMGLADGFASYNEVLDRVKSISSSSPLSYSRTSSASAQSQNTTMFGKDKFKAVLALSGVAEPTSEQVAAANTELVEAGIAGVVLTTVASVNDNQAAASALEAAEASIVTLTDQVSALTTERDNLLAENTTLNEWKNTAGAAATTTTTDKPDTVTTADNEVVEINSIEDDPFSQQILKKHQ